MLEQQLEALTAAINGLTRAIGGKLAASEASEVLFNAAAKDNPRTPKASDAAKPEPVVEAAKPEPVVEAAKPEPVAEAPALTYEIVRAVMLDLNTKKGRDATLKVLGELGVQTVPQIGQRPELFAKAVELAKAAL